MQMIAALFVQSEGVYFGLDGVLAKIAMARLRVGRCDRCIALVRAARAAERGYCAMNTCHYCNANADCRPYGPRGEMVCFQCAFASPDREADTRRAFHAQIVAATGSGNVVVIGEETGPRPVSGRKSAQ